MARGASAVLGVLSVGVAAGVVAGLWWLGTWPPVATVESDSMRPTAAAGDLLVLGQASEVAVGEVIVVPVPERLQAERGYPERLAHRVVEVTDGRVTTKGDRLEHPDPFTVPVEVVSQQAVAVVPWAGHVLSFLRSPVGMIWLVGGLLLVAVAQRGREEGPAPATADDVAALRAEIVALAAAQRGAQEPVPEAASPASEEPAPVGSAAPVPLEGASADPPAAGGEPLEPLTDLPVAVESGWPAPLRPTAGQRAAMRASKVGEATRHALAELARTRRPEGEDADDRSEDSA